MNIADKDDETSQPDGAEDDADSFGHFLSPANQAFYKADVYNPLNPLRKEIRLCKIVSFQEQGLLQLQLFQPVSLLEKPKYDAVSYCAGDSKDTKMVLVNGVSFNMFASVYGLLEQLRRSRYPQFLWVDQVCINQSDLDERGQQVSLMREIYTISNQTLIWVGMDEQGLALSVQSFVTKMSRRLLKSNLLEHFPRRRALRLILQLGLFERPSRGLLSASNKRNRPASKQFKHLSGKGVNRKSEEQLRIQLMSDKSSAWTKFLVLFPVETTLKVATRLLVEFQRNMTELKHIYDAMAVMFDHPWWRRSWTFQEIVCAPQPLIIWGNQLIHFNVIQVVGDLVKVVDWTDLGQCSSLNKLIQSTKGLYNISRFRSLLRNRQNVSPRKVLETIRSRQATDPRDQVYSTLGLLGLNDHILPCYQLGYTNLHAYSDVTQAVIQVHQELDIITDAGEYDRNEDIQLPSWVPNYAQSPNKERALGIQISDFNTSLSKQPRLRQSSLPSPLIEFHSDNELSPNRILICYAIDLGKVTSLDMLEEVNATMDRLAHMKKLNFPSSDQETETEEAWRRIVTAASMEKQSTGAPVQEYYEDTNTALQACLTFDEASRYCVKVTQILQTLRACRKTHVLTSGLYRLFVTPDKNFGIAPVQTRHDDRIMILMGCSVPLILRPRRGSAVELDYQLVGPCYLYGYMHGRAVADLEEEGRLLEKLKQIRIH